MSSPLKTEPTQKSALSESIQLNDSFSQELQPIVYTPEGCRKPLQNPSTVTLLKPSSCTTSFQAIGSNIYSENSLKISCEVDLPVSRRKECKQEDLDSMFTICEDTRRLNSKLPEQQSVSNNNIVQRYRKRVLVDFCPFFGNLETISFFSSFSYIWSVFHISILKSLIWYLKLRDPL